MILTNLGSLSSTVRAVQQAAFIQPAHDNNHEYSITFAELDARADAVGAALYQQGYQPGERVALLGRNSVAWMIAFLGILRAGLVAVPVNIKFPPATLADILIDCDARQVIGEPELLESVTFAGPQWTFDALVDLPAAVGFMPFQPQADSLAMLLYTSGSTGMPKGVRLTHASHRWVVETRLAMNELAGQRVLIAAPFYHMNALALALLTLASGVTTVLLPQFQVRDYIAAIAHYRCSWLTAVPPMIAMMMKEKTLLAQSDLSSVRVVRMGSAPVNDGLFQQIQQIWPQARIINAYGTTEGGPIVFGPHPDGLVAPQSANGYAHPAVSLRLRDEHGTLTHHGVLEIKSPALMQGYHQRPDIASPFTDDGYYRSGDVFTRDEQGFYTFVGRQDDMFVCGGENIYPGEVERLLEQHPAVQQACVVAIPDEIKGSKPVAWVIPREGYPVQPEAIKAWTLQHGPAYLHPRHIWLTAFFPLAGTNKVDRHALRRQALQQLAGQTPHPV
ncbi:acetyl-CoA synthetase [Klebsiella sp. RIT-PI-d]|uniref:class I adenylate-forming enzyme family protein n=1 Tax=Klebsiella sp. RIT-PI-d TaxID=1681196 RepID=UPI000675D40D|nr:class I adenylate-forming enzyme family protein [Klebsiella sp. RIT-PI-d]KNC09581.1 acetyl-CoA synthetase [Klebsiella sp. RIT-PI-d]